MGVLFENAGFFLNSRFFLENGCPFRKCGVYFFENQSFFQKWEFVFLKFEFF